MLMEKIIISFIIRTFWAGSYFSYIENRIGAIMQKNFIPERAYIIPIVALKQFRGLESVDLDEYDSICLSC